MGSATERPSHPPPRQFPVLDDCLQLGGVLLTRLAERVGRTPFYAYERDHVRSRIDLLRRTLPQGVQLHYAIKANPMPALVCLMAPLVDGFDVASAGEMKIALDAGMAPSAISFAGPGKSNAELRSAVAAGVLLHLESEEEMKRAAATGALLGLTPRVAVRVNPDFELKYAGMKMAGGAHQFGIDAERVPAMLRQLGRLGLDFHGFHLFCGAQNLSATAIGEAQRLCVDLALRLAEHAPSPIRTLNIGGGLGVPYFPGERPLDFPAVADGLHAVLDTLNAAAPGARLVLELGRYLVAEAGVYVCRVLERKLSHGQTFLITDGGMHHHLAASGNFGQVIRKNYPVAIGNRMYGGPRETATVVGPLCTPLDMLADGMELTRAEVGDFVVVFQSGAYGLTASPTAFLGHPGPAEVLV
ncbi:pyridoxal-dependent decarboxylase, exosortase A system-associated [Duganella aceris]|uniref:Pyridoxal-dependent decarboxylase, exosortase A system-associated n=1 Tax=Duganella aceris TaxID=2703883 RepID=A0ABX0FR34_9BURK|nr:pyridoxal-dependent decarboxylase, exosortase A system-associated [Duganella aceris]NGZ87111.1 pyridoxal-dependent decarboxylase, exosortase A system-associated [Duganella aceris]